MSKTLNYNQFIRKYDGKCVDVDGVPKNDPIQCVDLAKAYFKECFEIPFFSFGGSAKNVFENFENFPQLRKKFIKIKNTPSFVPKQGDVAVWGSTLGNGNGHISICTGEGDTRSFYSYDQNFRGKKCHRQIHSYKGFLGVLRPKK